MNAAAPDLTVLAQWVAFGVLALIAIGGAIGMTTTMSMFRSGILLMASFVGVSGLFILLLADLLALLQVMMYVGGMLVMILFMVLFSHDPGGAMMAGMTKLRGPESFFSRGIPQGMPTGHEDRGDHGSTGPPANATGERHASGEGHEGGHHGMSMAAMSMFTPIKVLAAILAALVGTLFVTLIVLRPGWALVDRVPDPDSPRRIGHLLMEKYMIAFEGAGLLILLGIFGAVMLARPDSHPPAPERGRLHAMVDEAPAPIEADRLEPLVAEARRPPPDGRDEDDAHADPHRGHHDEPMA